MMRSQIKEMTQGQPWEFIMRGLEQNKSRRAIAKELSCDEGTIRRELRKLELPEHWVEAIKQGSPAERFVRTLREYDADPRSVLPLYGSAVRGDLSESESACHAIGALQQSTTSLPDVQAMTFAARPQGSPSLLRRL
jgi:IS30 family transposase